MLSHQYDWITVNTRLRLICQNVSPVLPDVKRTFEFSARESNAEAPWFPGCHQVFSCCVLIASHIKLPWHVHLCSFFWLH